jgi:hypothetical protein
VIRALTVLAPLAALLVVSGCGDGSADGGNAADTGETSLSIEYWEDAGKPDDSVTWMLTCDPTGGSHPDPEAACDALASVDVSVFEPVPPDTACIEIFGGPQRAEVSGTLNGGTIEATFNRRNGCEIERWDAVGALLPSGG